MAVYDLSNLVDWARRLADQYRRARETASADGSNMVVLDGEGDIKILRVTVDNTPVPSGEFSIDGSELTFVTPPAEGSELVVNYRVAAYDDPELTRFLAIAASSVQAALELTYRVYISVGLIDDINDELLTDADDPDYIDPVIAQLIVHRAALDILSDKANLAAGDAIMVKDGPTAIDTSKTAGAGEKAVSRMQEQYEQLLKQAQSNRFRGAIVKDACHPFGGTPPTPVTSGYYLPGNGPLYTW